MEQQQQRVIVVRDPRGSLPAGAVYPAGSREVELGKTRGLVTLPVDLDLLQCGVGDAGYAERSWGFGVPFEGNAPVSGCPITLFVEPHLPRIHWAARLVVVNGQRPRGTLRLRENDRQPGGVRGVLGATAPTMQLGELGDPDDAHGWNVSGELSLHTRERGYLGLLLQGVATGCRVLHLAVSQSA